MLDDAVENRFSPCLHLFSAFFLATLFSFTHVSGTICSTHSSSSDCSSLELVLCSSPSATIVSTSTAAQSHVPSASRSSFTICRNFLAASCRSAFATSVVYLLLPFFPFFFPFPNVVDSSASCSLCSCSLSRCIISSISLLRCFISCLLCFLTRVLSFSFTLGICSSSCITASLIFPAPNGRSAFVGLLRQSSTPLCQALMQLPMNAWISNSGSGCSWGAFISSCMTVERTAESSAKAAEWQRSTPVMGVVRRMERQGWWSSTAKREEMGHVRVEGSGCA